jgi:hypothetical protein
VIINRGGKVMPLLTTNKKTQKSDNFTSEYHTAIVQLYPNMKTCPSATKECIASCLVHSGMGSLPSVKRARKERTNLALSNPSSFYSLLDAEISLLKTKLHAQGTKLAVRINGISDLDIPVFLFKKHKDVQFYDYTKVYSYLKKATYNKNYHLTFSYSGSNLDECKKALKRGFNVSVVARSKSSIYKLFNNKLNNNKKDKNKLNIIDGNAHDLRFLDAKNSIVQLRPTGVKKSLVNNFINN